MRFSRGFLQRLERIPFGLRSLHRRDAGNCGGNRTSKRLGFGIEFAEHLNYTPGDDLRYLDWQLYARLGQFQLKQFAAEGNLSVTILIDSSASMAFGTPSKFERALEISAGLSSLFLRLADRITLFFADKQIRDFFPPVTGRNRFGEIIRFLENGEPNGRGTDLLTVVQQLPYQKISPGPIWLISDFYGTHSFQKILEFLLWKKFRPIPIHISDLNEFHPSIFGEIELADAETGETRRIAVNRTAIKDCENAYRQFKEKLQHTSRILSLPFYEFQTCQQPEEILLDLVGEMK